MYFPKSQIKENLYTSGGEFVLARSGKEYIGKYFSTSTGKFYTGKNTQDKPNNELRKTLFSTNDDVNLEAEPTNYYVYDTSYYKAKNISSQGKGPRSPIQSIPEPTEKDYKNGSFFRYFVKKTNESQFIEIDKKEYTNFSQKNPIVIWNLYTPIKLNWQLEGKREEVYLANKNIVSILEKKHQLYGFSLFFRGKFGKYFKSKGIEENLITDGTEYMNKRTGKPYAGKYHIHPEKGPMVGARHVNKPHDYLVPIVKKGKEKEKNLPNYSGGY